ncbi:MAG TPA: aminotransferase class V-fold PLP-dependent enzyme, partial [Candidatus Parcubacteria bacterium]|nr:aminotransferase class V-fold PLP-dependent enzyme [Candidatus Parcubacteria bacterium]
MVILSKAISTSLSPNIEKDDIKLAFNLLFKPSNWIAGRAVEELEEEFKKYLGVRYAFSFNSGRSALMAILYSLGAKKEDEILIQSFTCTASINPILYFNAKPVFIDIDDSLNLDPLELEKKITGKSKAVVLQHTFGWPAKVEKILEIAKKNNLFVIEDVAHSLGAKYKNKLCGSFGDASFFSFGRDKIISSVFGGMAVTNNQKIAEKIKEFRDKISYPSRLWAFQQILHPILVNYFVLPAYSLSRLAGLVLL